jgi:hypothetical protein
MGQFSMEKPALKGQFSVEINTDALRSIGLTDVTYRRWQYEYGGGLIGILGPAPE